MFGLNNLLDERYFSSVVINAAGARYFEPAPGRNIYLGVGVAIGNWH
jgi:iron complex outermembrane receptor protein